MEKILITNNRIAIEEMSSKRCVFLVDGLKKAEFVPQDEELYNIINELMTNGIKKEQINTIKSYIHRKRAQEFVRHLEDNGFIDYMLKFDFGMKVTIKPIKKKFRFPEIKENIGNNLKISNHTFLRFFENTVILENPLATFRLCIEDLSFNLQLILQNREVMHELLSILITGGFITDYKPEDGCNWEFHDLLFHTESRLGMIDDSISLGGTYRFKPSNIECFNGFKNYENKKYYQFKDIPSKKSNNKVDFFEILRLRKSDRSFSNDKIVSYSRIGEFLFHTAKAIYSISTKGHLDFIKKTFPSAGGIHDLEFYLLINKSDSLPRDIYYYHPQQHGLYQLQIQKKYLDTITQNSMISLGNVKEIPPIIVILTSRFNKMRFKYERIAYRNTILSVGAAFQTMYLTGTAMNLSTCALGSGNPDIFAEAINVDPFNECAVGEFVIGPKSKLRNKKIIQDSGFRKE